MPACAFELLALLDCKGSPNTEFECAAKPHCKWCATPGFPGTVVDDSACYFTGSECTYTDIASGQQLFIHNGGCPTQTPSAMLPPPPPPRAPPPPRPPRDPSLPPLSPPSLPPQFPPPRSIRPTLVSPPLPPPRSPAMPCAETPEFCLEVCLPLLHPTWHSGDMPNGPVLVVGNGGGNGRGRQMQDCLARCSAYTHCAPHPPPLSPLASPPSPSPLASPPSPSPLASPPVPLSSPPPSPPPPPSSPSPLSPLSPHPPSDAPTVATRTEAAHPLSLAAAGGGVGAVVLAVALLGVCLARRCCCRRRDLKGLLASEEGNGDITIAIHGTLPSSTYNASREGTGKTGGERPRDARSSFTTSPSSLEPAASPPSSPLEPSLSIVTGRPSQPPRMMRSQYQASMRRLAQAAGGGGFDKFHSEVRELVSGRPVAAARGLMAFLKVNEPEVMARLADPMRSMVAEIEMNGTAQDVHVLRYVLHEAAGSDPTVFANGRMDEGRYGETFADFCMHASSRLAGLDEGHVLALRLYSTAFYHSLNTPLRDTTRTAPHPFPITMLKLSDGIKRLRAVEVEQLVERQPSPTAQPSPQPSSRPQPQPQLPPQPPPWQPRRVDLFRGMRDTRVPDAFREGGGTELAPMSTTSDLTVALKYSESRGHRLLFKIRTESFMERGADIAFLSAFPGETNDAGTLHESQQRSLARTQRPPPSTA